MTLGDEFNRFVERRAQINEELDSSRVEVDAWIEMHRDGVDNIAELATLEGLLAQRRELLERLARLDDSFMNYLLQIRNG
jgi:hypothetical protein